jgi:hypothetical protein
MNKDEWTSLVTVIVAMAGTKLATYGVDSATLQNSLNGLFAIAMVAWTLWHNWNLRKVAETSVVTSTAPTVSAAKAESITAGK